MAKLQAGKGEVNQPKWTAHEDGSYSLTMDVALSSVDEGQLQRPASENPVATAMLYQELVDKILEVLAVAAAVKGYSYAADSARIVHGLHASLLALGVRAWFEYVRTDANVSDKPSREDLSTACYALGEVMGEAINHRSAAG